MNRAFMLAATSLCLACGQSPPPVAPAPTGAEAPTVTDRLVDTNPQDPTEVVLWHAYRGLEKDALEQAVDAWHGTQRSVRVRVQAVPYDPFVDKIGITVPRGQGPDLFIFAHNMIGSWVDKEILEPMGDHVEPAALRAFVTQSVQALVHRQNLYGLPLALKSLVLFHNTALLPEVPEHMEALLPRLQEVMAREKGVYGLAYEAGLLYFHAPWMHAFGGAVFDETGAPALDSPAQVAALRYAEALRKEHKVLPDGVTGAMVTKLFNDGKVAAVLNGPWFRAEIREGLPYAVSPIPSVAGAAARPFLTVEAVFVSRSSPHKEAAIAAASYLAGAASAAVRLEVGKQPVAHRETLEASRDANIGIFREQAQRAVIMRADPEMQLVWSPSDSAIGGTIFGERDAADALSRAQTKITAEISRRRGP